MYLCPGSLVEGLEGGVVWGEEGELLPLGLEPLHEAGLPQRRSHAPKLDVVLDDVTWGRWV